MRSYRLRSWVSQHTHVRSSCGCGSGRTGFPGLHGSACPCCSVLRRARGPQDFGNNYAGDTKVKIPWVRRDLCGARVLVMEWIDGMRCTNIKGIQTSGIDVNEFIRCGVVSGLRQLLEVWQPF